MHKLVHVFQNGFSPMCLAASLTAQLTTENIVTTPKMIIREKETKLRTSKAMKLPLSHFACFLRVLLPFGIVFRVARLLAILRAIFTFGT